MSTRDFGEKPIWKRLIEFAIELDIQATKIKKPAFELSQFNDLDTYKKAISQNSSNIKDYGFFSTDDFCTDYPFPSRMNKKMELSRTYNKQMAKWLKHLGVNSNFVSKCKLKDNANPKHTKNIIYYHYYEGAAYEFFVKVLEMTCRQCEGTYEDLLDLTMINVQKMADEEPHRGSLIQTKFGKQLNHNEFIKYWLRRHHKVHLPKKEELISYMKNFVAESFLRNCKELQVKN